MHNPDSDARRTDHVLLSLQRRKVPVWVWLIVSVYLLLFLGVLALPAYAKHDSPHDPEYAAFIAVTVSLFAISGLTLLIAPVRIGQKRPMSRKSFLIPLIASGLLFAALVAGAVLALAELIIGEGLGEHFGVAMLIGMAVSWLLWTTLFWMATRTSDPISVAARFHQWLLAGSVVELLVAVPCHIIVRRRTDCCVGIATGMAICLGAMVMFVSFGPSVLMLYWRRARQIRRA